jgi:hypothetical protein
MASAIVRRRKRPTKKAKDVLPESAVLAIDMALKRLARANGVLTAIVFCADEGADIDLSPVAICARDSIDRVITGLASILKQGGAA